MKRNSIMKLMIVASIMALAIQSVGCGHHESSAHSKAEYEVISKDHDDKDGDMPEREETRQSYKLDVGADVKVSGINGPVEIETADVDTAEVHIIRSAKRRDDLEYRKIVIEHSPSSLTVKGEKDGNGDGGFFSWFKPSVNVRQRVQIRLPRQVDFTASGINGRVNVGEIDGEVQVSGINGAVKLEQARKTAKLSGINGSVEATIAGLFEDGLRVSGVNGKVELRFSEDLNADVRVDGINGGLQAELPNVTMEEKKGRGNYRARIGEGGIPITVSGVNGSVRLSPAGRTGGDNSAAIAQ